MTMTGREAEEFGRRLKAARVAAGLSLAALARKVGCTRQMLSKWENGQTSRLDYLTVRKVGTALGIDADALLKRRG